MTKAKVSAPHNVRVPDECSRLELVQGQLEALGYEFIDSSEEADVVLLNTCSVRELSEHKVWSALGRLASNKRA